MISGIPPGLLFIIGALLIPVFQGWTRNIYLLFIPVLAFFDLLTLSEGVSWTLHFTGIIFQDSVKNRKQGHEDSHSNQLLCSRKRSGKSIHRGFGGKRT